jgi:para-nitrobenzyl esterase
VRGGRGAPGVKVFKGMPFAAAPVGSLRFMAAQPAKPW